MVKNEDKKNMFKGSFKFYWNGNLKQVLEFKKDWSIQAEILTAKIDKVKYDIKLSKMSKCRDRCKM